MNIFYCPITIALIVINGFIFLLIKLGKLNIYRLGMSYIMTNRKKEYYRIITSAFTHEDPVHILCNMYSMYNIGSALEPALGPKIFAIVYIIVLLGGGGLSYLIHRKIHPNALCIGASGTICGLLGVYSAIIIKIYGIAGIRSVLPTIIILVLMTASKKIDSIGHFSGLAAGLVCGCVLAGMWW